MDDSSRAVFASRPVEFNPFTELNLTTDPRQAERIDDIDVQSAFRRLSLARHRWPEPVRRWRHTTGEGGPSKHGYVRKATTPTSGAMKNGLSRPAFTRLTRQCGLHCAKGPA